MGIQLAVGRMRCTLWLRASDILLNMANMHIIFHTLPFLPHHLQVSLLEVAFTVDDMCAMPSKYEILAIAKNLFRNTYVRIRSRILSAV